MSKSKVLAYSNRCGSMLLLYAHFVLFFAHFLCCLLVCWMLCYAELRPVVANFIWCIVLRHSHSLFRCFVFIDCAVLLCCAVGYIAFCYNDLVYESLNQLPRSAFQRALTRLATLKFKFNFYLNIFNYDCMA